MKITVTVGPLVENEPHHMQYLYHQGDKVFAGGLLSSATYVFDVSRLPLVTLSGSTLVNDLFQTNTDFGGTDKLSFTGTDVSGNAVTGSPRSTTRSMGSRFRRRSPTPARRRRDRVWGTVTSAAAGAQSRSPHHHAAVSPLATAPAPAHATAARVSARWSGSRRPTR